MRRVVSEPRPDHLDRVEAAGLRFHTTDTDRGPVPYWFEGAHYRLQMDEVLHLEERTEELYELCRQAVSFIVHGDFPLVGLPEGTRELARRSVESEDLSLYARFDLAYGHDGSVKMLELNGDTPTGLIEGAVAQWQWLQDTHPELDQWNSLHERLVAAWKRFAEMNPGTPVHFAHAEDPTGIHEELLTVTYLQDTAMQAGLETYATRISEIGYRPDLKMFVSESNRPMEIVYKLYPWEDMLHDQFGPYLMDPGTRTSWLEPAWKVLASDKTLLAALWHLNPGHENLLPTYLDSPRDLEEWVAKPIHGREGDGIVIHAPSVGRRAEAPTGPGYVFQQWNPLPDHDGNRVVLGSWIVEGEAAGVGIRESDGFITDYYARFLPHLIESPAPREPLTPDLILDGLD